MIGRRLSLFPSLDHEWLDWSPQGYYETSPLGDRKYLGWHRNRLEATRPTDYFAFDNFEQELRQPEALLRLLEPGEPGPISRPRGSPTAECPGGRADATGIRPPGRARHGPVGPHPRGRRGSRRGSRTDPLGPRPGRQRQGRRGRDQAPRPRVERDFTLSINPGIHMVSVIAVSDQGKEQTQSFPVLAEEPPRPPLVEVRPRRPD